MSRTQNAISWLSVATEISHFFCCGIPIIFSLLSLLANVGMIASMPIGLDAVHHFMHDYEIPMIAFSGAIIVMGWGIHLIAARLDCRSTGCAHVPCDKKKARSTRILKIASVLYLINVTAYFLLHT